MIGGLQYVPDYLDGAGHDAILSAVDGLDWKDVGGRRIQFYGHWFDLEKGVRGAADRAAQRGGVLGRRQARMAARHSRPDR